MAKRQICFQIDETRAKELEAIRTETGLPISRQIEIELKGYIIIKQENFEMLKDEIKNLKTRIEKLERR